MFTSKPKQNNRTIKEIPGSEAKEEGGNGREQPPRDNVHDLPFGLARSFSLSLSLSLSPHFLLLFGGRTRKTRALKRRYRGRPLDTATASVTPACRCRKLLPAAILMSAPLFAHRCEHKIGETTIRAPTIHWSIIVVLLMPLEVGPTPTLTVLF